MTNQLYEKAYNASSTAEAKKIISDRIKVKDIEVIKSKSGIDPDKIRAGDIVVYFKKSTYVHTALGVKAGYIADCTSARTDSIKCGVKSYSKWKIGIIIRYTGK